MRVIFATLFCRDPVQLRTLVSFPQQKLISANSAQMNGGGPWTCWGTIERNTITGNSALLGGGLSSCRGTIRNNVVTGNFAIAGGGLLGCDGTIENNTISGNRTEGYGGGLRSCEGTIVYNCYNLMFLV